MTTDEVAVLGIELDDPVVVTGDPGVDRGLGAGKAFGNDVGILQCFPCRLEEKALLRVDPHGLGRGDTEEVRIERRDVVEVSAGFGAEMSGAAHNAIVEGGVRPSIRWNPSDGILLIQQELPEFTSSAGLPRETTTYPHDGNALACGGGSFARGVVHRIHRLTFVS
nr:hypothetical protein [Nocardia sp. BMG51109]